MICGSEMIIAHFHSGQLRSGLEKGGHKGFGSPPGFDDPCRDAVDIGIEENHCLFEIGLCTAKKKGGGMAVWRLAYLLSPNLSKRNRAKSVTSTFFLNRQ